MRVARVAAQNVRRVFPELNDREVKALLEIIWDNLGRGACEFAHMDRFSYDGSILELKLPVGSIWKRCSPVAGPEF